MLFVKLSLLSDFFHIFSRRETLSFNGSFQFWVRVKSMDPYLRNTGRQTFPVGAEVGTSGFRKEILGTDRRSPSPDDSSAEVVFQSLAQPDSMYEARLSLKLIHGSLKPY